ncbi:MAG: M20/M25/M40 family metallo-hydrolase [Acidobacteria bacterium]|nr:M20/M25/M40 family metallo-hydrolase [Acidobacteriota bacterium]
MKTRRWSGVLAGLLLSGALLVAQVPAHYQPALDRIRAQSLAGRLSFLASDLLEGRGTPSRGLDLAAEYIASELRAAGLEPAGNEGYFQTANWLLVRPKPEGLTARFTAPGRSVTLACSRIEARAGRALHLENAPVYFVDLGAADALHGVNAEAIAGKVVVVSGVSQRRRALDDMLRSYHPLVVVRAEFGARTRPGEGILVDPELPPSLLAPEAKEFFKGTRPGATDVTLSLDIPAPDTTPVKLRNVAALLKGSDVELAKTFLLVTAHYDHLGMKQTGDGDRIYNGADDDGSGVVSVLELAGALAQAKARPRRSILFLTFFGEELGLLGSQYYGRHPLVPLEKTVANINIEQVGRTDDSVKPRVNQATITGFDYSTLTPVFVEAGKLTGIEVVRYQEGATDSYFSRSDNVSLAQRGVVAHTVAVALEFPDYHSVGDEWQKVDYENMARVNRMIALGTLLLADNPAAPEWNAANPAAEPYRK